MTWSLPEPKEESDPERMLQVPQGLKHNVYGYELSPDRDCNWVFTITVFSEAEGNPLHVAPLYKGRVK